MAVITVGTLTFYDRWEQNFTAFMVERGVLGFPKHNLAPSYKNKERDICPSALHAQGCRP